jgi:DNA-binding NarL/FixJ family response regulator
MNTKSFALTPPMTCKQKATVFILDELPLVREWLAALINQQPDLRTCGETSSLLDALKLVNILKPRIVIVDVSLDRGLGFELIKDIKAANPDVAVIAMSTHDDPLRAKRALGAGALGYVIKREATENMLRAIRCVQDGNLFLNEKMAMSLVESRPDGQASLAELLSDRELEVFELLAGGRSTRQIAKELNVSFSTVQNFCSRIKSKLGLSNATELLREAVRWNDRQHSL